MAGCAVWLYLRFSLSFRDVEDLLAQRGITVSLREDSTLAEPFRAVDRGGFAQTLADASHRLVSERGIPQDRWSSDLSVAGR